MKIDERIIEEFDDGKKPLLRWVKKSLPEEIDDRKLSGFSLPEEIPNDFGKHIGMDKKLSEEEFEELRQRLEKLFSDEEFDEEEIIEFPEYSTPDFYPEPQYPMWPEPPQPVWPTPFFPMWPFNPLFPDSPFLPDEDDDFYWQRGYQILPDRDFAKYFIEYAELYCKVKKDDCSEEEKDACLERMQELEEYFDSQGYDYSDDQDYTFNNDTVSGRQYVLKS